MATSHAISDDSHSFPPFSSLPFQADGPRGNAWGRFGAEDNLGMLNLLTPTVVAQAAGEIKTGERVSLDWPLNKPLYPSYKRVAFRHEIINRGRGDELRVVNDDLLTFNTQCSSQWDGFRHFGYQKEKRYFNNRTHEDIGKSTVLGIDAWANSGGIVGRGVLLDYASWALRHEISLDVFTRTCIPMTHIHQLIEESQITFHPGDILFLRIGFNAAFNNLSESQQEAISLRLTADFAGIEATEETLKFLWNNQFAAVASDCPAFEASPVHGPGISDTWSLHQWLLGGWGMPIGEMFDLEALSEKCKETGRWSFFMCSVPLKVPGGVASPPNAVAIF